MLLRRRCGPSDAPLRRLSVSPAQARIDDHGDWTLMLLGHGHGIDVPVGRETWDWAAGAVAMNVAADNAEAVDRTTRGESGWTPLWPLPDRRPRS
jgi:hypothetical protein